MCRLSRATVKFNFTVACDKRHIFSRNSKILTVKLNFTVAKGLIYLKNISQKSISEIRLLIRDTAGFFAANTVAFASK